MTQQLANGGGRPRVTRRQAAAAATAHAYTTRQPMSIRKSDGTAVGSGSDASTDISIDVGSGHQTAAGIDIDVGSDTALGSGSDTAVGSGTADSRKHRRRRRHDRRQ